MNADENAVASVLKDYETALNASDTEAALKLYAPDGVFMPQHSPASVGTGAVRKAYDAVFAAITLTVRFEIAEIRQIAPDWVLARTNSAGTSDRCCKSLGEPGAFPVSENRRRLEDCPLLLLHDKSAARLSRCC